MRLFSTEQVSKFHPDKMCDQISDAILDLYLSFDPKDFTPAAIIKSLRLTDVEHICYEELAEGCHYAR